MAGDRIKTVDQKEVAPERGALRERVIPRLKEIVGGKLGDALTEGLLLLQKDSQDRVASLKSSVSSEMNAMRVQAEGAEEKANSAESSARSAAFSASSAAEAARDSKDASAKVAGEFEKVYAEALRAEQAADGARSAAESAQKSAGEVAEALEGEVSGESGPVTLRGKELIGYVLKKFHSFQDALGATIKRSKGNTESVGALRQELDGLKQEFEAYKAEVEATLSFFVEKLQEKGIIEKGE